MALYNNTPNAPSNNISSIASRNKSLREASKSQAHEDTSLNNDGMPPQVQYNITPKLEVPEEILDIYYNIPPKN